MDDKSGVGPNALILPKGGGAATGVTQGFQADLSRGTGTYSIRIIAPPGRGGLQPDLQITYSSAAGFGPTGLGWSFGPLQIQRRMDIGSPTYVDDEDVFTFGGEELLHVGGPDYRCLTERNFWRITRIGAHWEARDRDGQLYVLGETAGERLSNPADPAEVLAWMLSRREDPNGNRIRYRYRRDQRAVTPAPGLTFTAGQLYLDRIEYNPHDGGWLHRIELHYDFDDPNGAARPDAHLSYRPGFALHTGWRLSGIEVHADVPGQFAGLIRRYDLGYSDDPETGLALLQSVSVTGLDEMGNALSLPPMTFGYARLDTAGAEVEILDGAPQVDLASGDIDLVDLTGNGLPDILSTVPGNHTFWLNNRWRPDTVLPAGQRHFAPGTAMTTSPNLSLLQPAVRLADVRGRMAADLMDSTGVLDSPSYTLSTSDILTRNVSWGTGAAFAVPPPFNFQDGRTRVVDLTGRGGMDVLRADGQFHHWLNHPGADYEDRGFSAQIPGVSFTDPEWTFADLNGDGLTEIVRVRNGRIEYFLNRAHGHRGGVLFESTPIVMGNSAALLQGVAQWHPDRLLFVDINGDGYDDAIYLHPDRVIYWINRSGWAWSNGQTVPLQAQGVPFLLTTSRASVRVGNVLGTGMSGLLWSTAGSPMRYLDLTRGQKPLLLTSIDNGAGGQTAIRYGASTRADDRAWTTRVPFTLQIVNQVTTTDAVTGHVETVNYRFLDGDFDRERREFLGFGTVEVEEVGDEASNAPACETRITTIENYLYTGGVSPAERARARALSGLPRRRAVSGLDRSRPYKVTEWRYEAVVPPEFDPPPPPSLLTPPSRGVYGTNGRSRRDAAGNAIAEPAGAALLTHELELVYDPAIIVGPLDRRQSAGGTLRTISYRDAQSQIDRFGRRLETTEANDVIVTSTPPPGTASLMTIDPTAPFLTESGGPGAAMIVADPSQTRRAELIYAERPADHLVMPVARRLTRSAGQVVEDVTRYYDGPAYQGLAFGQADRGNLTREEVLVLRDDQLQAAYSDMPGQPPDLLALGFRRSGSRLPQRPPLPIALAVTMLAVAAVLVRPSRPPRRAPATNGYVVDMRRYRYASLPNGAVAYGVIDGSLDPRGSETVFQADPFYLHTISRTDPAGNTATATVDYRVSELTSTTDANGQVSENRYDALGRVITVVRPGDNLLYATTVYEYPAAAQPLPAFIRIRQREQAGAAGTFDSVEYVDGWSRKLQTRVEAEGGRFVVSGAVEYGARGGILTQALPYFENSPDYAPPPAAAPRFRFVVDALDRDVGVDDPDPGSITRKSYHGLTVEESDREDLAPGSPHFGTPTSYRLDTRGNVLEVHQRLSAATVVARFQYNVLGKLTALSLSGTAPSVRYQYDLLGRRLRTDHVDAGTVWAVYDARGNLAQQVDGLGRVVEHHFDGAGRLAERRFPTTGEPIIVFRYCDTGGACAPARHAVGRLAAVDDAGGTVRLSYDARGNLEQHERTWDEFGVSRSYAVDLLYDSAERLRTIKYPLYSAAGTRVAIEHRYNAGNLREGIDLVRPAGTTPLADAFEHDARGQRTRVSFGNGLVSEFAYHPARLHLEGIRTFDPGGATLQDLLYCHDREGNVVVTVDAVSNMARLYTYDALYRLREAREIETNNLGPLPVGCGPLTTALAQIPATIWPYQYSPEGDLLELGDQGLVAYTAGGARPHADITVGGQAYHFDMAGRLERIETIGPPLTVTATLEYNARGLLARIDMPVADRTITFVYDYENERLGKLVTERSTGNAVSETRYLGRWVSFHGDGAMPGWQDIRQYVFDGGRRIAVLDEAGDPIEYVHPDLLGSAATISDAGGRLACTLRYQPFGAELNPQGCPDLRHRFNGKETDAETGLVNFGTRHYQPALGRWITPDPMLWQEPEKLVQNPQALNAYAYALNNPATLIDPVGKSPGQYAGEYIDTRRTFFRKVRAADGTIVHVYYRVIEAKPGTWLSKVTYDFGWGEIYSKQQGYGAYNRAIIYPLSLTPPLAVSPFQQLSFNPDKIRPGQLFAVQIGQVTVLEGDTTQVGVRLPEDLSKEWAWRTVRGVSGGEGFAIETLTIEIMNKRSGKSGTFTYYGGGYGSPGLPVGVSTKSDWYSFTTKYYLTLQDFEGDAVHGSVAVGAAAEELTLANRGEHKETVRLIASGTSYTSLGASQTAGYLERRHDSEQR
jgi:RHS repeat-associated protein